MLKMINQNNIDNNKTNYYYYKNNNTKTYIWIKNINKI